MSCASVPSHFSTASSRANARQGTNLLGRCPPQTIVTAGSTCTPQGAIFGCSPAITFLESFLESNSPMQILLEFHAQTRQETPYDIKQSKGDAPILQDSTTPSIASSRANASSSFTTCQAVARPTLKLRNHSFGRHTTAVSKFKGNCRQRTGGTAL